MRCRRENYLRYAFQEIVRLGTSFCLLLQVKHDLFDYQPTETVADEDDLPSSKRRLT